MGTGVLRQKKLESDQGIFVSDLNNGRNKSYDKVQNMPRKVQALYDFDAQPGTGELSINTGDILTVTRTDVGEGWWEGTNAKGESGLFPEAYVEEYDGDDDGPPSMAPPPLPPDYSGNQSGSAVKNDMMDMGCSMPTSNTTQPNPTAVANTDD